MIKILAVAHCILNTASKVTGYNELEQKEEAEHRRRLLDYVRQSNIQLLQNYSNYLWSYPKRCLSAHWNTNRNCYLWRFDRNGE